MNKEVLRRASTPEAIIDANLFLYYFVFIQSFIQISNNYNRNDRNVSVCVCEWMSSCVCLNVMQNVAWENEKITYRLV